MSASPFGGVMVALSTPFDQEGEVVEGLLRDHVDRMVEAGVHGIVPGGSTGEFASMSTEERFHLTEVVLDQVAGRVPVVVGTGSPSTREAISLSAHAEAHGAAGVMLVAPYYETPTRREVLDFYVQVSNAVEIPVVAYNLPQVTGINLDRTFLSDLMAETGGVTHVKDTSGNMEQALDLILNLPGLTTFVGLDTLLAPALLMGSKGTIWGAPNFAPEECLRVWNAVQEGRVQEAIQEFNQLWNVLDFLGKEGYSVSVKAAAAIRNIDLGLPRRPFSELPSSKSAELRDIMAAAGLIN